MTENEKLYEIVREAFNQDYFRQQAINALVASGVSREEAEKWVCEKWDEYERLSLEEVAKADIT